MKITYVGGVAVSAMLGLSACVTAPPRASDGQIATSAGTAPTYNRSGMTYGLDCVRQMADQAERPIRFAVSDIKDLTGKFSNEASEGGFRVTQGGTMMVISALGELGKNVELIERYDSRIAEQERVYATNALLGDGGVRSRYSMPNPDGSQTPMLQVGVRSGDYVASDYYITGALTEVNYNLASGGFQVGANNIGIKSRYWGMNVAADLRLVDTRTLRVVKTARLQKQIVGEEQGAGIYKFFGDYLVDVNAGTESQEPLQLGVRAILERATAELVTAAFSADFEHCKTAADYGFVNRS